MSLSIRTCSLLIVFLFAAIGFTFAQDGRIHSVRAENRPLESLSKTAARLKQLGPDFGRQDRVIPNFMFKSDTRAVNDKALDVDPVLQGFEPLTNTNLNSFFDGADNYDNAQQNGYYVAPPDTDGDVGPNHYVQMVNSVTAIYTKTGTQIDVFRSNAIWSGAGGACQSNNDGDPIVLYDSEADRWLISQFVSGPYAQCVAISQTGDPTGAYNRYEFDFSSIGFPDYPKHGITSAGITMTAHIFNPNWAGQYIGVMDKAAMYAGTTASLIGTNLGTAEGGFVAGDLDGPGSAGALFATAMSRSGLFDIWEIVPNFSNGQGTVNRIAAVSIPSFSGNLCTASREACIPQPDGAPSLESLSDRLMHRLQIRDFGSYKTMVASHTVNVGSGRAGVRWYELRNSGSGWSLYQSGTYAPNDGLYRWMPSVAMNAAGDIGVGYMVSSTSTYVSIGVAGQSAANSGTGILDSGETICAAGNRTHTGTSRSGDYSATAVDEGTGEFWHTNEYFRTSPNTTSGWFWATGVCRFDVGTGQPPPEPTSIHVDNLTYGTIDIGRGEKRGQATVRIVTDTGSSVAGATVSGTFSGTFNETVSGTTGSNGTVTFQTEGSAKKGVSVAFCVSNVSNGLPYAPEDNTSASYACDGGGGGGGGGGGSATTLIVTDVQVGTSGGGQKRGTASVTVRDENNNAVSGATVTGNFGGDFAENGTSAVTNSSGIASFSTSARLRGNPIVTFCVTNVAKTGMDDQPNGFYCGGAALDIGRTDSELPEGLVLEPNYPNPFNPTTTLAFSIGSGSNVNLSVYNLLGQHVATLVDGYVEPGRHSVRFDASGLPGGVYLYRVQSDFGFATGRVTLVK